MPHASAFHLCPLNRVKAFTAQLNTKIWRTTSIPTESNREKSPAFEPGGLVWMTSLSGISAINKESNRVDVLRVKRPGQKLEIFFKLWKI
jgi:hypothetical protein